MARGPLPSGGATRRRNAPTIPTTSLPAGGRKGRAPVPPLSYKLGPAGKAWWKWAWRLPQAAAWDDGALYAIARRAELEDELAAINSQPELDLSDLDDQSLLELKERIDWVLRALKSAAGGSATVMREMRELDNRLGLNPKALAELRWTIVDDTPAKAPAPTKPSNVRQLRPRDPSAATG